MTTNWLNNKSCLILWLFSLVTIVVYLLELETLTRWEAAPLIVFVVCLILFPFLFRIRALYSKLEGVPKFFPFFIIAAALILLALFYLFNYRGELLLHDDHSSFLQRQSSLLENFPRLFNYDPSFNAGQANEVILLSGTVNLFLVTTPLRLLLSLEEAYTLQPLLLILFATLSLYFTIRLLGGTRSAGCIAAFLSLCATLPGGYFCFPSFLRFGMLPFLFSTLLSLPIFALFWRVFISREGGVLALIALILLTFLAVFHLSFAVMMAPLVVSLPWLLRGKGALGRLPWLLLFLGTLLLHVSWFVPFWNLYHDNPKNKVTTFSPLEADSSSEEKREGSEEQEEGRAFPFSVLEKIPWGLRSRLSINPFLFLGILGALRWLVKGRGEERRKGILFSFFILYFLVLIVLGNFFAGFLQPGRYLVPLSFFLIPPALSILSSIVSTTLQEGSVMGRAALYSLFFAGIIFLFQFSCPVPRAPQKWNDLAAWLQEERDTGGRIYFEDFHEALGGHIAYLQVQVNRPFVCEQYDAHGQRVHNQNRLTDFGPKELKEYFTLYNISTVVLRSPSLGEHLLTASRAKLVHRIDDLQIFETGIALGYFLKGGSSLSASPNKIEGKLDASGEAVLKYRWVPGLTASEGFQIESFPTFTNEEFIKITGEPGRDFSILYERWWLF